LKEKLRKPMEMVNGMKLFHILAMIVTRSFHINLVFINTLKVCMKELSILEMNVATYLHKKIIFTLTRKDVIQPKPMPLAVLHCVNQQPMR